jgi:serine/threonine-protein kinase
LLGERDLDGRADIYALGCVLYEMLAGEAPCSGPTPAAILAHRVSEEVPPLSSKVPGVPPEVEQAVHKALASDREDRFDSAEQFATALLGVETPDVRLTPAVVSVKPGTAPGAAPAIELEPPPGRAKSRGLRWGIAVAALAAAALIVSSGGVASRLATWLGNPQPTPSVDEGAAPFGSVELDPRRIAVLYFDDMSEGQDLEYLAAGLTDALIQRLSQVQGLEVISRNGVKPFRNADVTVDSIVRALQGPGTIVQGSVMGSADRIRVNVQLIDPATNTHIDSRLVEQPSANQLDLVDKVTHEVQEFLRKQLGEEIRLREIREGTDSPEAWTLISRAQLLIDDAARLNAGGDTAGAQQALTRADFDLARAERLDPEWSTPLVKRGRVALDMSRTGKASPADYSSDGLTDAIFFANEALQLTAGNPAALELRGTARLYRGWGGETSDASAEWTAAEGDLQAAVEADPFAAGAWASLSRLLLQQGRSGEAISAIRRAFEADAFLEVGLNLLHSLAHASVAEADYDEALRLAREGQRRYPIQASYFAAVELLTFASPEAPLPDVERAWEITRRLQVDFPDNAAQWNLLTAAVLARLDLPDSARAVLARFPPADDGVAHAYAAVIHLHLGDRAQAISHLERYLALLPQRRQEVATDFWWKSLHDDPDFQALLVAEG